MNKYIDVCYCVNKTVAASASLSIWSLLNSLSSGKYVRIHILTDSHDFGYHYIDRAVKGFEKQTEIIVHHINLDGFKSFNSLHGDYMAYGRILIPTVIESDWVVYLDTDTMVHKCISNILKVVNDEHLIYARPVGLLDDALDRALFLRLEMDMSEKYFNSGVLLINAKLWRYDRIESKIIQLAHDLKGEFRSADETLFNIFFYKKYGILEREFNTILDKYVSPRDNMLKKAVITHFVGSPKPWDFLGSILHNHYYLYRDVLDSSGLKNEMRRAKYAFYSLKRYVRLGGRYYNSLRDKIKPVKL